MNDHWLPADKHVASLISEAQGLDVDDYTDEEKSGLIEDLCSCLKRAHFRIEQLEKKT